MAKGSNAKIAVQNKIAMAFGADYIGEQDKKIYVWADDGGEKVQIAISMTCPKTPIATENEAVHAAWDWSEDSGSVVTNSPTNAFNQDVEISEAEKNRIAEMMKRLNL